MLVVDASVAFNACAAHDGFDELGGKRLLAPPLMWSEARSALHLAAWQAGIRRRAAELETGRGDRGCSAVERGVRSPAQLVQAWP